MKAGNATAATLVPYKGGCGSTPLPAAMPRYQIVTGEAANAMRPILVERKYGAYHMAQKYYAEVLKQNFFHAFEDCLEDGYGAWGPNMFAMARRVEWLGWRGWFIEFSTTYDMGKLLSRLPPWDDSEFFSFRRDGGDLRVIWDYEHFRKKLVNMKEVA